MNDLAEEIEMTLDSTGRTWTRREDSWAVPTDGVARELRVSRAADGLRIDAVLIEWDEAAPESLAALARFLEAARPYRCEIEATRATLLAEVSAERVESELPAALATVSAGCRFLAREAKALLAPDLARKYVMFQVGERGQS